MLALLLLLTSCVAEGPAVGLSVGVSPTALPVSPSVAPTEELSASVSPSPSPTETLEIPDGYALYSVTLPSSQTERKHYNFEIFAIDPFQVEFALPQGWTVQEGVSMDPAPDFLDIISGLFNIQYILDESGKAAGYMGYFLAPMYDDPETMEDPQALFAGINLVRHRFDCQENYTPVEREDSLRVATTAVIREALNAYGDEEWPDNDGVLIRDEERGVCVAIELERGRFTAQELTDFATRLTLR